MYATLANSTWARICPFLKRHPRIRKAEDAHVFLNAVLWILRTGAQWRALPESFGKWNSIYKRFRRWSELKIFEELLDVLSRDADYEWLSVDSTTIRAHMSAAGAAAKAGGQKAQSFGRSRGGFSTKIHVKTDALGLPLKLYLTGGNRGDMIGVWGLLEPEDACAQALLADRAYDANALRDKLEQAQIKAVIPCNPNSRQIPYDKEIYKARHVVECLINKIKWFRRIATRYDKLDLTYLNFLHLACCIIWLR